MTSAAIHLPLWADILATTLLLVGAAFALLGSWALAFWSDRTTRCGNGISTPVSPCRPATRSTARLTSG
jgi:hypothetical protein